MTAASCGPLDAHEIANAVGVTATSSLNVTATFASSATSFWLASGVVSVTVGAASAGGPPHGIPPLAAPGVDGDAREVDAVVVRCRSPRARG